MTVCLNQRLVLETPVEAEHDHTFTITPPADDTDFHRLDVAASATSRHRGDTLSLQVRELTTAGTDGRPRRLIE